MSRGALQKMLRRSRYEERTEQIFCTRSETWSENRSSRFEPEILLISFSRGSGPPLKVESKELEELELELLITGLKRLHLKMDEIDNGNFID